MKDTYLPVTDVPLTGKLRSPLAPVALTALKAIQTAKVCPKGFELFLEGRKPCGIYILYSGRVELSIADSAGRRMMLGTAMPGDVLGLSAAVSGTCYEETAVATVTSQTGFIKCQDFLHFMARHPEAAFWVVQLLSDRVTATLDQLSCINDMPSRDMRQPRRTQ